jgi:hypothetical protein
VILAWLNQNGETGWEAFFIEHDAALYRVWLRRHTSNVAAGLAARGAANGE